MQGNNLLKLAFALRRTTHCVFPWAENVIRAGVIYLSLICGAIWANYKTGHLWFVGIVYINKDPKEIGWFAFSMHSLETVIAKNWYIFGEPWQVRGWTHVFSKANWWESQPPLTGTTSRPLKFLLCFNSWAGKGVEALWPHFKATPADSLASAPSPPRSQWSYFLWKKSRMTTQLVTNTHSFPLLVLMCKRLSSKHWSAWVC